MYHLSKNRPDLCFPFPARFPSREELFFPVSREKNIREKWEVYYVLHIVGGRTWNIVYFYVKYVRLYNFYYTQVVNISNVEPN